MLPKVPIAPYGLRAPSQGREHRTAPQRPTLVPTGGNVGAGQFEQAAWAAPPQARGPDCTTPDTEARFRGAGLDLRDNGESLCSGSRLASERQGR